MPSTSLASSPNQGDGIYEEAEDQQRKQPRQQQTSSGNERDELLLLLPDEIANTNEPGSCPLDSNHNQVVNRQSAELDNILNILNQQLEQLDLLKADTGREQSWSPSSVNSSEIPNETTKETTVTEQQNNFAFEYPFIRHKRSQDTTGSVNSQTSRQSSTLLTRRFLLDNYIASSIKDRERDCNCRYHLGVDGLEFDDINSDDQELDDRIGELENDDDNEFYREETSSPVESTGSCSLREIAPSDEEADHNHDHDTQQVSAIVTGGAASETLNEYVSGTEIDCRNVPNLAPSSGNKRQVTAAHPRLSHHNHRRRHHHQRSHYLGGSLAERASEHHEPSLEQTSFSADRQHYKPLRLKPPGANSLFIDSESVQSLRRREIRANGRYCCRGRACLSAPNNQLLSCSRSESDLQQAIYGRQRASLHRLTDGSSASLPQANIVQSSLPELSTWRSYSGGKPSSGCDCCCQLSSPSEISSIIDSDYDEEDFDLEFDTRSALDCVEESPSNNELSLFPINNYSDQSKENSAELYCSLTNDNSANSRQNSPLNLFLGPNLLAHSSERLDQGFGSHSLANCERPSVKRRLPGGPSESDELVLPANWTNCEPPAEFRPPESSVWLSLHKMDLNENNACKSNHALQPNKEEPSGGSNLSDLLAGARETKTSERHDDGPALKRARVDLEDDDSDGDNHHCDHKRENLNGNSTNRNRLKLNNGKASKNINNGKTPEPTASVATHLNVVDSQQGSQLKSSKSDSNVTGNKTREDVLTSMRAAKDLVKLSIPSLSSLQYLPGQMETRPARFVDQECSKRMALVANQATSATILEQTGERVKQTTDDNKTQRGSSKHADEDSGLLHRLCLCNCMAQDHASDASDHPAHGRHKSSHRQGALSAFPKQHIHNTTSAEVLAASTSPTKSSVEDGSVSESMKVYTSHEPARMSSPHSVGRRHVEAEGSQDDGDISRDDGGEEEDAAAETSFARGRVTKEFNSSSLSARDVSDPHGRQGSAKAEAKREKQSPSFLSRLGARPSSQVQDERIDASSNRKSPSREVVKNLWGRHRNHSIRNQHNNNNSDHEERKLNPKRGPSLLVGSDGFGSIGDLGASGRSSSASGGTSSDVCSPLSRSNERSDESSSCKSGRKSADILSDGDESMRQKASLSKPITEKREATTTTDGACLDCKQQQPTGQHKRRLKTFRKLLTPNKLFTSTSSICEHTAQESDQPREESKSFLSRSLSRLSGRKHHNKQASKRDRDASEANPQRRSACASPDASISNNSQPDTFSDSINSLEELDLTQSLPYDINRELGIHQPEERSSTRLLTAPRIVLSKVEYQEVEDPLSSCDNMARSTGGGRGGSSSGHRHSRVTTSSNRNYDNRENRPMPPPNRHGSELSCRSAASQDSDSFPLGPVSLPSSPGPSQRRRHHHNQKSRSPRLSQSPVPFHSPPSESTKIEDGLQVCSMEHFEKHIGNIKGDQIETQKRLFTAWINHFAPNLIRNDLFEELKDGIKLIGLLAALTHDRELIVKYDRLQRDRQTYVNRLVLSPGGQMRNLTNVSFAIDYLRRKLGMSLVGLHPMDIVSSKATVILGLCWNIIMHFQSNPDLLKGSSESSSQMEQTMKNWISYEQARQDLRNWLKTAEAKLIDALRPDSATNQPQALKEDGSVDYVGQYSNRLDELIEYFELEPIDMEDFASTNCSFLPNSMQDEVSTGSLNNSLSGSHLSLGSNTSRFSAVTSSKKATYRRLFDQFELKCRLLAAMLEPDQRDSLLKGVKELKSRLKYIIDIKVPQVINEIRLSIDRCEMSIKEQDEICSDLEVESLERESTHENEISQRGLEDLNRDNGPTSPECNSDGAASASDECVNDLKPPPKKKHRNRTKRSNNKKAGNKTLTPTKGLVKVSQASACADKDDDECNSAPFHRKLWNKICRASKMSMSFNIVLLVCLAGLCIIPLIQRDACCELSQAPVASDRFTINQRPT